MDETPLPFPTRLWFAFLCFFRVLIDAHFAGRAYLVRNTLPPPPPPHLPSPPETKPDPIASSPGPKQGALQVLAAFQREGRLIDFLQEDPSSIGDTDLGAAARQIHQGCRQALHSLVQLDPVRSEEEGQTVQIPPDYNAASIKLTGDIKGTGPYRGTLSHRGWRVREVNLPTLLSGADPQILAPAEVELSSTR